MSQFADVSKRDYNEICKLDNVINIDKTIQQNPLKTDDFSKNIL